MPEFADDAIAISGSRPPRKAGSRGETVTTMSRSPDQVASPATSVVVGVDGCGACQGALQYAIEEANRRGCGLVIVAAYERCPDGAVAAETDLAGQARAMVQRCLDLVIASNSSDVPPWRIMTKAMPPVDALAAAARNAGVIVVGRHHGQSADGTALGSTTRHLLDHSPIPVVSVSRGYRWQR